MLAADVAKQNWKFVAMRVSVSIVTYNTNEETLGRLLHSLHQDKIEKQLVIVDNSPGPSRSNISQELSGIEYVHSGANLGYGRGHNLGIKRVSPSDYPYHLVVNPDIFWDEQVLVRLVDYMEANPDVASVMPKVLYPDGELQHLCKLLPTPFDLLVRRFLPTGIIKDRLSGDFDLRFTGYQYNMNVPYLSGCFMFLRRSAFDAVGGFDERFFMYPEDIDLTRRLHQRWRTMFHPSVKIYHAHGKASYKSRKMLTIHLWNMCKYFNKWGWFFDHERRDVNRKTLTALRMLQFSKSSVKGP